MVYNTKHRYKINENTFKLLLPPNVDAFVRGEVSGKRLQQLTESVDDMLMTQIDWTHIKSYNERIRGRFLEPREINFGLYTSPYGLGYTANGAGVSKMRPLSVIREEVTEYDIGRVLAVAAKLMSQSKLVVPLTDTEKEVVKAIANINADLVARILSDIQAITKRS